MIEQGKSFPEFSLPNQDNKITRLTDFRGKWLVIYVYPKDDTPGCTLEGKGFSAAKERFEQANARVLGLSQDDVASHKSFCEKYSFSIPLLSDGKAELLKTLGVPQSDWKGTQYWERTTFLVDPNGVLRKVYQKVKPEGHEQEVLQDIKRFSSN